MPGDKKHHTDKFRRCVEQVMADGKEESTAYAICTSSLQEAGESIFEAAERNLHLLGATGQARTEVFNGTEYLVVPVVALMEGVIHAVNAETPEFVPFETLEKAAATWNDRPVVLGHPLGQDGKQCSANSPAIIESHGIGILRNSRVDRATKKMLQEAWIEKAKAKRLHPEMYAALEQNKPCEVSVGAFVSTIDIPGKFNDKKYKGTWAETIGDHLAFLPGGRGACSIEMGCGAHRAAAMHLVTAESIDVVETEPDSLQVLVEKFQTLAGARHNDEDRRLIQAVHDHATTLGAQCDRGNYKMMEAGDDFHRAQADIFNKMLASVSGKDTESHTVGDTENAAATKTPQQLRAACGCQGEKKMSETNTKKAELIAALVTDKHSGFKEGDEKFLETVDEARLEEFRASAATRATADDAKAKLENEQRNLAARLKIADEKLKGTEEKLKAAEQKPTKEQWLEMAPPEIRALLDQEEKRNTEHRTSLVTQLKAAQSEFNEEDLGSMELSMLERLARTIKIDAPADYSGKGLPLPRAAAAKDTEDYAPPNPYEAGIKALQSQVHKH